MHREKKRAQVAVFILMGVLLASALIAYFFAISNRTPRGEEVECARDDECVPAECCHASACVPKSKAPSCRGVVCSANVVPGTVDEGECKCRESKCVLVLP